MAWRNFDNETKNVVWFGSKGKTKELLPEQIFNDIEEINTIGEVHILHYTKVQI